MRQDEEVSLPDDRAGSLTVEVKTMDTKPAQNKENPSVGRAGRSFSIGVGAALIGAGSLAVFRTDNGAGSLGLLVGGVFLLIIGITGFRPTRLVIGGNELVLEKLDEVQGKVSELSDKVWQLFLVTMAPSMYENLEKLASEEGFGKYEMTDGLKRELVYLRDHGYIENIWIEKIPPEGPNLSPYITVTDAGRKFVELRKEWQS